MSFSQVSILATVLCIACLFNSNVTAFAPSNLKKPRSTALFGAFNKGNKQADLMAKMAAAKKQREKEKGLIEEEEESLSPGKKKILSDAEMKKQNDMKRFEQLLDSESSTLNYDISGSNYKTKVQEEEDVEASVRGIDRMFEGDPAPTEPFEDLIFFTTGNALGKNGASRVVPWLNKNSAKNDDILIVVTDPREKSSELRTAIKNISKLVPADTVAKLIVINADSPGENRKFLKKNEIENINIYTDEKRNWMREYTVLGDNRWAMCLMVLTQGRVEKIVREMDVELATQVIKSVSK